MRRFLNIAALLLFFAVSVTTQAAITPAQVQKLVEEVDKFANASTTTLKEESLVPLATRIIRHRDEFPAETIAKMYLLLAKMNAAKGEISAAFQFANDGLSFAHTDYMLTVNLILIRSEGHYANGKFELALADIEQAYGIITDQNIVVPVQVAIVLSYRAMMFALTDNLKAAEQDLISVREILRQHPEIRQNYELNNILAAAYYFSRRYPDAINLFSELIQTHYGQQPLANIEEIFNNRGNSYLKLREYVNARTDFEESLRISANKSMPIQRAYAELGLGIVYLKSNDFAQAKKRLLSAQNVFSGENQMKPLLTSTLKLAKAYMGTNDVDQANELIAQANDIANQVSLTSDQFELYRMNASMYAQQGKFDQAYYAMQKYNTLISEMHVNIPNAFAPLDLPIEDKFIPSSNQNVRIEKDKRREQIVQLLSLLCLVLLGVIVLQWLKHRNFKMENRLLESEKPRDFMPNPGVTKELYQTSFKMARKYDYPIAIGYLLVDNWQELEFKFSQKVSREVARTIATLINESIGEFDSVGLVNQGEYLVLCPHQSCSELKEKMNKLQNALNLRIFANLGDFSVSISFACDVPSIQDIDPYIFLSRLSDSLNK